MHRPKYDDWSWAKGKLDPGEHACVAAARETLEETGLVVRLGVPLPSAEYPVLDATGGPATKQVHYWSARVTGGTGTLEHEIDEVAWVDVRTAHDRLDYARDREQLLALVRADRADELRTWPIAFVRHAKATPRGKWSGDDRRRPLDAVGRAQATTVSAVLGAYGVTRVVSSSSTRCVATVEPYAAARGLRLRTRDALSEEGFAESEEGAVAQVRRLLERGDPAAAVQPRTGAPDAARPAPHPGRALPRARRDRGRAPARRRGRVDAQGRGARLPPRRARRGRARRRRRAHRHLTRGRSSPPSRVSSEPFIVGLRAASRTSRMRLVPRRRPPFTRR